MFCENCGKKIEDGSGFCPACGNRMSDVGAKASLKNAPQQPILQQPAATNGVPIVKKTNGTTIFLIIAIAVVAMLILILAVTFPKSSGSDANSNVQGVTDSAEDSGDVAVTPAELSDDLFSYTVELDGVVYKFPCDFSDFTKNGWKISEYDSLDENSLIGGDKESYVSMEKGNDSISIYPYNYSGNAKKLSECKIGGFSCYVDSSDDIAFPKGINMKSDFDDIKAAYGEPDSIDTYESNQYATYTEEEYKKYVKFTLDKSGNIEGVEINNFIKFDSDKTQTSDTRPEYLDEYKAPKSLGSNTGSGNFKLEGKVYRLPVPLSVLLDDGWKITQKPGAVAAGQYADVTIEKGKASLMIDATNFATYQTTVENCAVTRIYIDDSLIFGDEKLPNFELPGKNNQTIKIGTSKTDLTKTTSVDFTYDEYTYSHSYFYYDVTNYTNEITISIDVDKESDKVSEINFSNEEWDY